MEKLGDLDGLSISGFHLGISKFRQARYEEAENNFQEALRIATQQGNQHLIARIFLNLGNIAVEKKQYDAAKSYYQQSQNIELALGNLREAASALSNLGRLALIRNSWDDAERYYVKAYKYQSEINDLYAKSVTYARLGQIELAEFHHISHALELMTEGVRLALRVGNHLQIANFFELFGCAALLLGHIEAAAYVLTAESLLIDQMHEKAMNIKNVECMFLLDFAKSRLSPEAFREQSRRVLHDSEEEIIERTISMITPEIDKLRAVSPEELFRAAAQDEGEKTVKLEELFPAGAAQNPPSENKLRKCPSCGSSRYIKNGKDSNGKQKYRCLDCGKNLRSGAKPHTPQYDAQFKKIVVAAYENGLSQRETARRFGISRQTLIAWTVSRKTNSPSQFSAK